MKNEERWRRTDTHDGMSDRGREREDASSPYTVIAGRFEFRARLSRSPYK